MAHLWRHLKIHRDPTTGRSALVNPTLDPRTGRMEDDSLEFSIVNYGNMTDDLVDVICGLSNTDLSKIIRNAEINRFTAHSHLADYL